jgi:hypothetical protein
VDLKSLTPMLLPLVIAVKALIHQERIIPIAAPVAVNKVCLVKYEGCPKS